MRSWFIHLDEKDFNPTWVCNNEIKYDKNFIKIIEFYLFKTPVKETSSHEVDMHKLGWNNNKQALKRKLYKVQDEYRGVCEEYQ